MSLPTPPETPQLVSATVVLENSLENRLNHVLFGLFLNDHYRREVLQRLGVTGDAVIYKPCNLPGGGGPPDFVIESLDGRITGYIEVELDKNPEQLDRIPGPHESVGLQFRARRGGP